MKYNWFESATPVSKIIISVFFMYIFLFVGFFIAGAIGVPIFNKGFSEIFIAAADFHNKTNVNILKYFQITQSITLFFLPPFALAILFGKRPYEYLSLSKRPGILLCVISILLIISSIPLVNFFEEINSKMKLPDSFSSIEQWMIATEKSLSELSETFLKVNTFSAFAFNIFMMAVLPALGEEFVFRGLFQRLFTEWFKNYHWGIIASAVLFSAFHFQFFGFIPRFFLGVMFGYLLVWSGSLWIPITAHFINNFMGVSYYYLLNKKLVNNSVENLGKGNNEFLYLSLSLIFVVLLMLIFYKKSKAVYSNPSL
jgi:uncharacterized protein